jgi:hypothetical protein
MPFEPEDEATSFESRPWGGQQRLIPLANRFARGTDTPPVESSSDRAPAEPARVAARPAPTHRGPRAPRRDVPPASVMSPPRGAAPIISTAPPTLAMRPGVMLAAAEPEGVRHRPTVESLPVPRVCPIEIAGELEPPAGPRISEPVELDTSPVPALTYCAVVSEPVEPQTMPMLTPVPQPLPDVPAAPATVPMRPQAAPTILMSAPPGVLLAPQPAIARQPVVAISRKSPPAIAAYSVKHGCSLGGGYVVPHLPKVAEVFRSSDSTVAVRRRPLTTRSFIAIPVGAVLAVVAILTIYLAQSPATAAPKAAAAAGDQPHVMKVTTIEAPAPAAAPAPVTAPIEAAPSPAGEPVIVDVAAAEPTTVAAAEPSTVESTKSRRRARSGKGQKPHRIVAVDSSTPLGNLRPAH